MCIQPLKHVLTYKLHSSHLPVLLTSAYLFYNIDQAAGLLMLPTVAWVSVATALQWSIYNLNKDNTCG